jgi:hypothetical protein
VSAGVGAPGRAQRIGITAGPLSFGDPAGTRVEFCGFEAPVDPT